MLSWLLVCLTLTWWLLSISDISGDKDEARIVQGNKDGSERVPSLVYTLLLSGWKDSMPGLLETLDLVQRHLLPWTPGKVILFHTGAYNSAEQGTASYARGRGPVPVVNRQAPILEALPSAEFALVPLEAWSLPEGLKEDDLQSWAFAPCCRNHDVGYRHMCKWYSNTVIRHLASLGFTWVLRLDEDSKVLSPARTNLAAWMEAHGKRYGYRLWDEDDTEVIWSLPEFTSWYLTARHKQPTFLLDSCRPRSFAGLNSYGGWDRKVIYNNFFLIDTRWWLSESIQEFLESLQQTNGHYLFRWGDAAVHTMVVKSFLLRSETHMFGFAYSHKDNSDPTRWTTFPRLHDAPP